MFGENSSHIQFSAFTQICCHITLLSLVNEIMCNVETVLIGFSWRIQCTLNYDSHMYTSTIVS